MSSHEPEKAGHCLCLLLILLDNLLLQSAATYRVLLFLAAGCARARAPTSWSWRRRADGGVPVISFVCSCDSTSKRALEHARSGATDVPRLLLRQYVQESFGAPGGHG